MWLGGVLEQADGTGAGRPSDYAARRDPEYLDRYSPARRPVIASSVIPARASKNASVRPSSPDRTPAKMSAQDTAQQYVGIPSAASRRSAATVVARPCKTSMTSGAFPNTPAARRMGTSPHR